MKPAKFLVVTEFGNPSGYRTIAEGIFERIVKQGHEVHVLGVNYTGDEHNYSFQLIPVQFAWVPQLVTRLIEIFKIDWVIFMMDAPKIIAVCNNIEKHRATFFKETKTAAIFPVESDPFLVEWAESIKNFTALRFTFTDAAVKTFSETGVKIFKLPVGLSNIWYNDTYHNVSTGFTNFVITVADNQIRKNLNSAFDIISRCPNLSYVVVTRAKSREGWDLEVLAKTYGIENRVFIVDNKGVTRYQLKKLYSQAKVLLLPSLAEGIGLPLYEAQSQGCKVVATNCCGIPEGVSDKRFLVDHEYKTVYPWGNTNHYWINREQAAQKLLEAMNESREVIKFPTWDDAADKFLQKVDVFNSLNEAVTNVKKA